MIEIIPAIMPDSWPDLEDKASKAAGIVLWAQVDVMDGMFVASRSWPYGGSGMSELKEMKENKSTLPALDAMLYEVDLMVTTPEIAMLDWIALGVKRVIVHVESTHHLGTFLQSTRSRFPDIEIGLALNIDTPIDIVANYVARVDVIQLMGIARIGYQGEPFDERVIPKIAKLREKYPQVIISVDGGVNFDSAPKLIEAGANRLVSGSAIYNSDDISEAIERLKHATST
jgi:ribulose-phosphate 3-epimerase